MKVTRHYENDHVILYIEEGEMKTCITLNNDRQLRRLGSVSSTLRGQERER